MKGRESGMPEEAWWESFFDPEGTLKLFFVDLPEAGDVIEFGCGYGTFTIPAARRTRGVVTALDIDPAMVASVDRKASQAGLTNIQVRPRDFLAEGSGLQAATQAHAMIFSLLHIEEPLHLLREARRVLAPGGVLSIMHWRSDIPTPRGPPLEIRPTPERCDAWAREVGFRELRQVTLDTICPYHFGLLALR